jgi:hypothetical protein
MPKTSKTTRKSSPATGKNSGLERRFSLTNRKVQFFVVVGLVAILGGGYYVRQSFASTLIDSASVDSGELVCVTKCTVQSEPSKNNAKVAVLLPGGKITDNSHIRRIRNGIRTCVVAKGAGILYLTPYIKTVSGSIYPALEGKVGVYETSSYKKYCTDSYNYNGDFSVSARMDGGKLISISQIFIETVK